MFSDHMTVEAASALTAIVPILFLGILLEMRSQRIRPEHAARRRTALSWMAIASASFFTLASVSLEVRLLTVINDEGWEAGAASTWFNAAFVCVAFVGFLVFISFENARQEDQPKAPRTAPHKPAA